MVMMDSIMVSKGAFKRDFPENIHSKTQDPGNQKVATVITTQ